MRLKIDAGGEWLLPYAKSKLRILHQRLTDEGQPEGSQFIYVDPTSSVFIRALKVGYDWDDTIRINVEPGGGWDFVIFDGVKPDFAAAFGTIDTPALDYIQLTTDGGAGLNGPFPIKSAGDSMIVFYDSGAWKWIDKTKKVADYSMPGTVATVEPLPDGEEKKAVAFAYTGVSLGVNKFRWELSDGTNTLTIDDPQSSMQHKNLATKSDAFFTCALSTVLRTGILSTGQILDITLAGVSFIYPQLTNYYDFFTFAQNSVTTVASQLTVVRNGAIDYLSSNLAKPIGRANLGSGQAVLTKDGVHLILDYSGYFYANDSALHSESLLMVVGTRNADGSYTYTETVVLFDSASYGWVLNVATLLACSKSYAYLFALYHRDGSGQLSLRIAGTDGTVVPVPDYEAAGLSLANISSPGIAFSNRVCIVMTVNNPATDVAGVRQSVVIAFSDGQFVLVHIPVAGSDSVQIISYGGSQTTAYLAVRDSSLNYYLVDSTGSVIKLTPPPDTNAIITGANSVFEVKDGCRFVFGARHSDLSRTFHHWDQTGALFNYTAPTFLHTTTPFITYPAPSSIHRMLLLDKWGP